MPAQRIIGTFATRVPGSSTVGSAPEAHSNLQGRQGLVGRWFARMSERRALRELAEDGHLLRDIGLNAEQVRREAAKPFWRP